jgi:nucleotide-binding universal stress UspA family protein
MAATKRILCPIDFSAPSRRALAEAADIARQEHASLTVLHVFAAGCVDGPTAHPASGLHRARCGVARTKVEDAIRTMTRAVAEDLPIRVEAACDSDPAGAILRSIAALEIDLVVMGTHNHNGLQRLLGRSTVARVLRDAPCPVLSIPSLFRRARENPACDR